MPSFANSGNHPSGSPILIDPFIAAAIPLVPEASWLTLGIFNQASDPFLSNLERFNS